jgi:anti-anti-sigma factor
VRRAYAVAMQALNGRSVCWDGHLLLVHASERQRRAGVTAWVRRGLDVGAKIFYVEPPHEPGDRRLMGVLHEGGVDAEDLAERGQLEVFPADERVYSTAWQASVTDEALSDGYPTVRWSGEARTAWSLMSRGVHADIEWATDELCQARPVSVLCQYPSDLTEADLQAVCAMHGGGLRETLVQTSPIPGGVAVAGEIDHSNARMVHVALTAASATHTEDDPFLLGLEAVDFLDVAGARALLTGTHAYRARGGVVRVPEAQPPVGRLLRLLGVDRFDGFSLEDLR